jgi:hypothetical protein
LLWGNITPLDKFYLWISKRDTSYVHDAVFMLEDVKEVGEVFENRAEAEQKIRAALEKN